MKLFQHHFVRNIESRYLLEIFLVTAATSVLGIRFLLALTGYPRLSPGNLHITHVLLGGAMMADSLLPSDNLIPSMVEHRSSPC